MTEKQMWSQFKQKAATGVAHFQRVETGMGSPGTPDVYFCIMGSSGWIELKEIADWPKKPETKVKVGLSPVQRAWHKKFRQAGGRVFLLLRLKNPRPQKYLLFYGDALEHLGSMTRKEMTDAAAFLVLGDDDSFKDKVLFALTKTYEF